MVSKKAVAQYSDLVLMNNNDSHFREPSAKTWTPAVRNSRPVVTVFRTAHFALEHVRGGLSTSIIRNAPGRWILGFANPEARHRSSGGSA